MVRSTFFGLEIGKTGLTVSQIGLDITGHNIANVDTDGYTRQRIIATAYDPFATVGRALSVSQANVGGGVNIKVHDQIRSAYLDRRYRTENTANAYWQKRTESMRYLESYFDNTNEETSINFSLARFFEAMKVLAEDTVEGAPRTLLQTAGKDLVQQLNSIYNGLIDLQESQNQVVDVTVIRINQIADEIAQLNKSIYGYEITGYYANDLRDKRNLLVDELSALADVEYKEYADGNHTKFEVSIGGKKLVNHVDTWTLGVREVNNGIAELGENKKVLQPYWKYDNNGAAIPDADSELVLKGGELKAYLDMRDGDAVNKNPKGIPYYVEMLNNFARALVQEVNKLHRQGFNDNVDGSWDGIDFFWAKDEKGNYFELDASNNQIDLCDPDKLYLVNAGNICLSKEVEADVYNIACSSVKIEKKNGTPDQLQRGNNENMNALYALFIKKDIALGDLTTGGISIGSLDGYATSIRFDVGNTLNTAIKTADNYVTLTIAAENQRLAVAGVSLDEEMTNLVKYQHAYNGAARVITAMDELLDKLINGTGRVGL